MAITTVELPVSATGAPARHYTKDETKAIAARLAKGEAVSDGVVYDKPHKKTTPLRLAQYQAFYLRQDLIRDGYYTKSEIKSKTWADGAGFRWGVFVKSAAA